MISAGDVGGTKTRLALYNEEGGLKQVAFNQYPSAKYSGLAQIAHEFLTSAQHKPTAGCFGIPGPVIDGRVKTPNLPWELSETGLSSELKIPHVRLVNDLVATTTSVSNLQGEGLITVSPGAPRSNAVVRAVLAPGTGTGQGFLVKVSGRERAFPSEGGHVDYSPTIPIEDELLRYLREKIKGRVSVERVLCGPGMKNIYGFLRDCGHASEPPKLAERMAKEDGGAVITQTGLAGQYDISVKALDLFCYILGSHAGDLVLTYMATGGMYLGGGIPPRIAAKITAGETIKGYFNKGRLSQVVKDTPLYIIKDDFAALLGAAAIAASRE